jgi:hypothetical protein
MSVDSVVPLFVIRSTCFQDTFRTPVNFTVVRTRGICPMASPDTITKTIATPRFLCYYYLTYNRNGGFSFDSFDEIAFR